MSNSIGTHNLLDGKGTPTAFADYLFFTESDPDEIRRILGDDYEVRVCDRQRDLVIAWRKGTFTPKDEGYRLAHPGIRKVTPHRGTYWIIGEDADGIPTVLVDEHRINAAFPPFRRGERWYRPKMWRHHTRMTLRKIKKWLRKGFQVFAGGDLNTPNGVSGYRGVLYERGEGHGHGYDRVGSSEPLSAAEKLSAMGSDHPRILARVLRRTAARSKRRIRP